MCIIGLPVGPRANKVMQEVAEESPLANADYGTVYLPIGPECITAPRVYLCEILS